MNPRFKNRIALLSTIAGAFSALLVFVVVYLVVFQTSYNHLDADIRQEATEVLPRLDTQGDSILADLIPEWEEREHRQIEVNPVFLQIVQLDGRRLFHSENMLKDHLSLDTTLRLPVFFNSQIDKQPIRIGQFPVSNKKDKIVGYLSIGVSRKESMMVLKNLRTTLFISYPFLILALFLTTSLAAAQSIAPVNQLIEVASGITDKTISQRLPLPPHKDEIYYLADTINGLLRRIENGLEREKQFTSDASHELRTPLAGIRGTLEVLIRKPRAVNQYEEKIGRVIEEVDRMDRLLDQLLQLSRLESGNVPIKTRKINLQNFLHGIQNHWTGAMKEKQIQMHIAVPEWANVSTDWDLFDIIVGNLVSNTVKYGKTSGNIICTWETASSCLSISDDGPGIPEEHLARLFDRFFRYDESHNSIVKGSGLGLSIVRKLCELLDIRIETANQANGGLIFRLYFQK